MKLFTDYAAHKRALETAEKDAEIERLQAIADTDTFELVEQRTEIERLEAERDELLTINERLRVALSDDPRRWSWDVLVMVGQRLLDEVYPADIFTGVSGDKGPVYVVALRNALRALGEKA
jgi:hypothetical protein